VLRFLLRLRPYLPRSVYRALLRNFWGTFWEKQLREQKRALGEKAASTLIGSERAVLVEAIFDLLPFSTLLEVGCSYGQLLHILAPIFPEAALVGVDPDVARVESGSAHFTPLMLSNVRLAVGSAEDLSQFASASFDLVVTSASLLYVPPGKINRAIEELKRLAVKNLLFLEQHKEGASPEGERGPSRSGEPEYWIRNYRGLLEEFFPRDSISIRPVPNPLWSSEKWQEYASLISVSLP